ncbi:hypothetical protein Tco_1335221 [Tanacetum coccineum]
MSDSKHSTITYTSISSNYKEPSDFVMGIMVYEYDGLPMHPPSPDYVPGPEQAPSPDYMPGPEYPPSPVYVLYVSEPAYPEFIPPEDDLFLAEEQPLPAAISSTTNSPDDDDDEESSKDDADNEEEDEGEDEDEEEHLAPADFVLPPAYRTTVRMSIRAQTPIPFPFEAEVDRILTIPTPPSSPLTPLSSPLPRIPSPPIPVPLPLHTSPTDAGAPLGYKAAMIRLRAESPSTSHPLQLPPPIVLPYTRASYGIEAAAPSTLHLSTSSRHYSSQGYHH